MWHSHTQVSQLDSIEFGPVPILTVVSDVCIVCWAREEMAQAVRTVVSGVEQGTLQLSDVTQQLLANCLYTSTSPDPELLIRTSGEVRLSDYLLWQVGSSLWTIKFVQDGGRVTWNCYHLTMSCSQKCSSVWGSRFAQRKCWQFESCRMRRCPWMILRRIVVPLSSGSGCPNYTIRQYNTGVICCVFTQCSD